MWIACILEPPKKFKRGNFRVTGDTVDIFPAYADFAVRILFWGDEIESIETFNPEEGVTITAVESINIYPANIFITSKDTLQNSKKQIQHDLLEHIDYFKEQGKHLEAKTN